MMTNTIQYDSKNSLSLFPLSLSLSPKNPLSVFLFLFFEKTLNPTSLQKKKKKKLGTGFSTNGRAPLFGGRHENTSHFIRQSSLVNVLRVFEKIDDDVNDDKERRQKRMRGEEEETAPVRRRALFLKHTHTHIYISIGVGVVFFFFLQCLSDRKSSLCVVETAEGISSSRDEKSRFF